MKISLRIGSLLASAIALLTLSMPAVAQGPAGKPNILFIMGDDIGIMQPSIYHRGLMVGETQESPPEACTLKSEECSNQSFLD